MTPENLLSEWARLVVGSLARAGVRQCVISPGSRSTPFAWAALAEPKLECRSVWDERAAAFFALGQARVSGEPTLLICTSGSAAANYYPAVIEACHAHVPLLVLSADRPFELDQCGASQTIDQSRLFGNAARGFFELGMPDAEPAALHGVVRALAQAVLRTRYPDPGAVQINARARKPLEPVLGASPAARALETSVSELLERAPPRTSLPRALALPEAISRVAEACSRAQRGLLVCGPLAPTEADPAPAITAIAEATGFPLLAEATSQLRFAAPAQLPNRQLIDGAEWLLKSPLFRERYGPDFILSFGATPTSGAFERLLLGLPNVERYVFAAHGFPDPHGLASELVLGDVASSAAALASALGDSGASDSHSRSAERQAWLAGFEQANRSVWSCVERELGRRGPLTEPLAVRALIEQLPEPCTLIVGNSLPIRDVDAYARAGKRRLRVLYQRGASGIEGLISGAAGAASVLAEPVVLLVGDVSFLHDLSGLGCARELRAPLVIALIDNGGGRIFEQLPIAGRFREKLRASDFWLTPPGADFSHAAGVFGHRYRRITARAEIAPALTSASAETGTTVLHLVVEASSAREAEERIRSEFEAALASAR